MCVCVMMCEFGGCIHVYRTKKKKISIHISDRENMQEYIIFYVKLSANTPV